MLVAGVSTGTAKVQAKLVDKAWKVGLHLLSVQCVHCLWICGCVDKPGFLQVLESTPVGVCSLCYGCVDVCGVDKPGFLWVLVYSAWKCSY